ncbi:MAG: C-GCAxxG-C-C family protein [Candidatus Bathyarchaeota archaeon]|nr:C-GCAxxG-C-C family protein [Candidatus Bathyarchaeota archaeon]
MCIIRGEGGVRRHRPESSTAMSAGVARKGETCGTLLGVLMAVGLKMGTESLHDFVGYMTTMGTASKGLRQVQGEVRNRQVLRDTGATLRERHRLLQRR